MKLADDQEIERGKLLLKEIVAMLTALSRSAASDRTNEELENYQF